MAYQNSINEFNRSKEIIPGGVNSPVRAFKSVGTDPVFIKKAYGSKLWDIDGNEYIDYVGSWGPMILGHAYEPIIEAVQQMAVDGTSFGAPTVIESEVAELVISMVPSVEMVRMVNSGTEATMSAIRLARGYTGRQGIIKFAGNYHGHGDSFLIKAGSGAVTLGLPDSPGVTAGNAQDTLIADFNDLASVEKLFEEQPENIAGVIVEPIAGNMGCVPPKEGFLEGLRALCDKYNAVLIFDEVMTGFRVAVGGAQSVYGVTPDLTTMGKIIGGGLPVGAYGGKKEIMEQIAPAGPIYQAGTLSGNPLAMAAGKVMLQTLKNNPSIYEDLEVKSAKLEAGLRSNVEKTGIPATFHRVGSMLGMFFTDKTVYNFDDAMTSNTDRFAKYFKAALDNGVYLAPSQFEAAFVSLAHSDEDIERTIAVSLAGLENL